MHKYCIFVLKKITEIVIWFCQLISYLLLLQCLGPIRFQQPWYTFKIVHVKRKTWITVGQHFSVYVSTYQVYLVKYKLKSQLFNSNITENNVKWLVSARTKQKKMLANFKQTFTQKRKHEVTHGSNTQRMRNNPKWLMSFFMFNSIQFYL